MLAAVTAATLYAFQGFYSPLKRSSLDDFVAEEVIINCEDCENVEL